MSRTNSKTWTTGPNPTAAGFAAGAAVASGCVEFVIGLPSPDAPVARWRSCCGSSLGQLAGRSAQRMLHGGTHALRTVPRPADVAVGTHQDPPVLSAEQPPQRPGRI